MIQTLKKTSISLLSHVKGLAIYNLWANKTMVNWLKTKPSEQLEEEIPSSFAGISATLLHIWDVERSWLSHLKQAPVKSFRMEGFDGTLDDILECILEGSEAILDYVSSLTEEALEEGCFFSLPYVGEHTIPAVQVLQHTLNHSTYHRGQIVTIGRNLGYKDAPMTDYMFYLLRVKENG